MSSVIYHIPSLCNLCGLCIGLCPVSAIDSIDGIVLVDESKCNSCGICVKGCPNGALLSEQAKLGEKDYGDFDLAIVGGGPAGMTAAYHAANAGIKTILIEKKKSLEMPLSCAEGVSKTGWEKSEIPIREEWISHRIEGGVLVSPNGVKTILHHPKAGYILDRRKVMTNLAAEATSRGAKIIVDAELIDLSEEDGWIQFLGNGKIGLASAKYIIAADGVESSVKKLAEIEEKPFMVEHIHSAAQYRLAIDRPIDPPYPVFYLGNEIAPGGYLWIFPKSKNIVNIGIGVLPKIGLNAKDYLDRFIENEFENFSILENIGGMVPADPIGSLRYGKILFAGDAANLTEPLSGGGIAHAFVSAREAIRTIQKALENDDPDVLAEYEKSINKLLRRKLKFYRRISLIFAKLDDRDFEDICDFIHDNYHEKTASSLDIIGIYKSLITSHAKLLRLMKKL